MTHDSGRGPAFYEDFFGFHRPPFSLAPDTRFRFQSASHAGALEQITYALERREPLIVVTGEIGTGKTLLCRTVVEQSGRTTFVSIINDPHLSCDDLLKRMLEDFGVVSRDRTAMTPTSRHDLVHALQEFLATLTPIHAHAAVIVDEAQHMQPEVLEQIRLVANIQDEGGTLLQIILVGQTDLDRLLSRPELQQLHQRMSRFVRLDPLRPAELSRYIQHRMGVARERPLPSNFPGARELQRELAEWDGAAPDSSFTPDAVAAVGRISCGIPRVVNLLCDRALEAAYSRQLRSVDAPLINEAAHALGLTTDTASAAATASVWPDLGPVETAAESEEVSAAPSVARRYGVVAASLVIAAVVAWFSVREISRRAGGGNTPSAQALPPQPAPRPQAVPDAATPSREAPPSVPGAPTPAATPPATSATPAPAAPPASPPHPTAGAGVSTPASEPGGERFEIVVASFRTAARATDVANAIAALPEPVRQRSTGGWQQVLAGPYASAEQARAAQQRLERAGFTGTHVTPAER
ncbi:MAG TPA: AAA family ATPase [Vicinamibacterales bacterium]|nr:AAA family ATPase [Vicinamibacterales bacterium]